jgi:hypothetical protein
MWNRVYWAVSVVGSFTVAFFAIYAYRWLQSIGSPNAAVEGFYYYSWLGWIALLIFSAMLLVIANIILWQTRHAWAIWTTLLYFAVFTLVWYFGLKTSVRQFELANGFPASVSALAPFIGVVLCVIAGAIAYLDQFVVVRLVERMPPMTMAEVETEPLPQPEIEDENEEKPPAE